MQNLADKWVRFVLGNDEFIAFVGYSDAHDVKAWIHLEWNNAYDSSHDWGNDPCYGIFDTIEVKEIY